MKIETDIEGEIFLASLEKHLWNGQRYHSLNYHLQRIYGEKVYKLAIDGGFTCPNRDGTLGERGCIFCSAGGSGDFAASRTLSITEQIAAGKELLKNKNTGHKYIAYFQAFTNTYAPVERLRTLYLEAMAHPDVAGIAIGTRPDCLGDDVLDLLNELNQIKPVMVELGLQTIHKKTAEFIRRGYPLSTFETAVGNLRAIGIEIVVHTILGLPGESEAAMLETADYLASLKIDGIKPQLLHVLRYTDLADDYEKTHFHILTEEEYIDILIKTIEILHPDTVIHRLTGDGPKNILIAPLWSGNKKKVLNDIHHEFKIRDTWQGRLCKEAYL